VVRALASRSPTGRQFAGGQHEPAGSSSYSSSSTPRARRARWFSKAPLLARALAVVLLKGIAMLPSGRHRAGTLDAPAVWRTVIATCGAI
jgi:hypothetical protein